jgi:mono/diheme cytochrome c family protein
MKRLILCLYVGLLTSSCHPEDIDPLERQPKYKPYSENDFFADRRAMRMPPEHTIPRERILEQEQPPEKLDMELLKLGKESYRRTCQPCHGVAGDSDSEIVKKMGLVPPPSLISARVQDKKPEELYAIISEGYGLMPRYQQYLTARERWATIAYVRALAYANWLPFADAPEDVKKAVTAAPRAPAKEREKGGEK